MANKFHRCITSCKRSSSSSIFVSKLAAVASMATTLIGKTITTKLESGSELNHSSRRRIFDALDSFALSQVSQVWRLYLSGQQWGVACSRWKKSKFHPRSSKLQASKSNLNLPEGENISKPRAHSSSFESEARSSKLPAPSSVRETN